MAEDRLWQAYCEAITLWHQRPCELTREALKRAYRAFVEDFLTDPAEIAASVEELDRQFTRAERR